MNAVKNLVTKNGNVELYTESIGAPDNPAVLLISGSMCPAKFWTDDFCNQIANNGYFVIRYDNRDTGLSSAIDYAQNPYSLEDLAADAVSVLDAYKIKKAHIIGGSMGGLIAQILALDYADRVQSIVLAASAVFGKPEYNQHEIEFLSSQIGPWISNKPTKNFEESVDGFIHAWQALHGDIALEQDVIKAYIKDMYTRTKKEHLGWFERISQGVEPTHNHEIVLDRVENRINDLKSLTLPILVIHGEKDWLIPFRFVKENLITIASQAQVHTIPGMGHIIFHNNLFSKLGTLINHFLQSQKS